MLNLGANQDVPQSDWKAVAQRVEAIQQGQISRFKYRQQIESTAQSVVNRLRARDLNGDKLGTGSVVTVDLDTMKHTDVRSVGCERLCLQALEDLQLGRILDELCMSEPDTRRALALVAAKMIHPASERETSRWIKNNSSLPELLGLTRSRDLERKTLYRIGDCLGKRQAEIEKHLFRRERDLLNIPATIVFYYDLSNTHCTGQHHKGKEGLDSSPSQQALVRWINRTIMGKHPAGVGRFVIRCKNKKVFAWPKLLHRSLIARTSATGCNDSRASSEASAPLLGSHN